MNLPRLIKAGLFTLIPTLSVNIAHGSQNVDWQPYQLKHKNGSEVQTAEGQVGYIEVAENRQSGSDKTIKLGFVRLPSTSSNPGNPIVYLSGGPGGSATGTAQGQRFDLFVKMREVADVILFDQRGTGLSRNGLKKCDFPSKVKMTQHYTRQTLLADIQASTAYCVKQWHHQGVDLNAYNTIQSAADLEALRLALGSKKIDLWGISYGTHLSFAMAKYYPQSVGRMVLASSEGPDHTVKLPALADNHLQRVAAQIAKDPKAQQKYPDLLALMSKVLKKYRDNPVVIDVKDRRSGQTFKMGVSDVEIQLLTAYALTKDPEKIATLPAMYGLMAMGNFDHIAPYLAYMRKTMWRLNPMSMAMDAASGISEQRWHTVQQQAKTSVLWRAHNLPFPDANKTLGVKDLGEAFRKDVKSDIPTLFLAGTLDGRTFIEAQQQLADGFSNSTFITIERAGHNLFLSSPKVIEQMMAFYRQQKLTDSTIVLPDIQFM
jgi:pimeloyl-ACP methyl ester carboxylesterase